MNHRYKINILFFLLCFAQASFSQSWNLKTVCKPDFIRTTGEKISINPLGNDLSASPLSLSNVSFVSGGIAKVIGSTIEFLPDPNFEGIANILYTSCDGLGNCGVGEISVMVVSPVKDFYHDSIFQSTFRNNPLVFFIKEKDLVLSSPPKFGRLERINEYEYSYTANNTAGIEEKLTFSSSNKKQSFFISIIDRPAQNTFAKNDVIYLNKNTSKLFNVLQNDEIGTTINSFTQPTVGSLTLNANQTFTFTTTLDFEGILNFEYLACKNGLCEKAMAFLYVSDFLPREDLKPFLRVAQGRSLVIPYEIPIQNYEYKIIEAPKFGTLDFYRGQNNINSSCDQNSVFNPLVYTPFPGFTGIDQFVVNFCLTNGTKQCAPIKVNVETYADANCYKSDDIVWPGDANNDGIVNLKDINVISELIGTVGPSRPSASLTWQNQPSSNWSRTGSINAKFADADGDGAVTASDIDVVISNFNKTHKFFPNGVYQAINNNLEFSPVVGVIGPEDDAEIQLSLGNASKLLTNIDVISFDLEFNDQILKAEDIQIEVFENSWFGYNNAILDGRLNAGNKISVNFSSSRNKPKNGYGKTVRVRTKGGPITGHAEGFKLPKNLAIEFKIKNLQLGQQDGNTIALEDVTTQIIVDFSRKTSNFNLSVYPNPASQWLGLKAKDKELIEQLTIIDLSGRVVMHKNLYPSRELKQDLQHLNPGIYFIKVNTNQSHYVEKLEVVR